MKTVVYTRARAIGRLALLRVRASRERRKRAGIREDQLCINEAFLSEMRAQTEALGRLSNDQLIALLAAHSRYMVMFQVSGDNHALGQSAATDPICPLARQR